jgi:hypothetical protein
MTSLLPIEDRIGTPGYLSFISVMTAAIVTFYSGQYETDSSSEDKPCTTKSPLIMKASIVLSFDNGDPCSFAMSSKIVVRRASGGS